MEQGQPNRIDHLMREVVAGTAGVTGEDFFRSLVRHLALALDVRYAFVAELTGDGERVRTLAFWSRDGYLDNVEYAIAGTPCEQVLEGRCRLYPQDVAALFPAEPELVDMQAQSYLAMPLFGTDGQVMGHLAVIDDEPMSDGPIDQSVLHVFGARVAAELERRAAEQARHRSEERLSAVLHSTLDAIVVVEESCEIVLFNAAAEQMFDLCADEALGQPVERLLSPSFRELLAEFVNAPAGTVDLPAKRWAPDGVTALRADGREFPVEVTVSSSESQGKRLCTMILRDADARRRIERELRGLRREAAYLRETIDEQHNLDDMVTCSPRMKKVFANVERVAPTDSTVLLNGETGVGKELMARAIHNLSRRADKPLIRVNCAALPAELIESELFGHDKGAFTGAVSSRAGRFELADKGTLFLDEVGELTRSAQAKLLRVLQEREFERVGGSRTVRVDVRVIAATNRDLGAMVSSGEFRHDLYYRLNVFPVRIPPLRERREDIAALARHFLQRSAQELRRPLDDIEPDSMSRLLAYSWPGNVRELQNVVERAAILADDRLVEVADALVEPVDLAAPVPHGQLMVDAEREHIAQALEHCGWRIEGPSGAARTLGLAPSTLRSRMKKLGIRRGGDATAP